MTLPPEIVLAATVAIVSFLGAMAAVFRFLPNYLQKRIDLSLEAQTAQIKEVANEKTADIEERRATSALLLAMSGNLDALTKAFVNQQIIQANNANEIKGNTAAITSVTEQNAEFKKSLDVFLDTGSKPLQGLILTVDRMDKSLITIDTKLDNNREAQKQAEQRLEKFIAELTPIFTHVQIILKAAEIKLQDVKKATGESPAVEALPA